MFIYGLRLSLVYQTSISVRLLVFLAETLKKECMEKDARIKALEHHNQLLRSTLERIKEMASHMPEA